MVTLPVAMLAGNAFGQVDVVLITSGRSSGNLANALLILVTNAGLDLLLVPKYGIAGAAGSGPVFPRHRQTSRVSDSGETRGGLVITLRRMNFRAGQATAHVGMIISRLVVGPPAYQHADRPARACPREA